MNSSVVRLTLALASALPLITRGAGAHEFWLSPSHYRAATGAQSSAPAAKLPPVSKLGKRGKGVKRGAVTATILENLKAAGATGVKIGELADKMGAKYKNIYIWFATTGKKYGIKRIAPATYRLA